MALAPPRDDAGRRALVWLCHAFFVAVLITGPLRKWVSPEAHQYLAFLHLPVLGAIYAFAAMSGRWPRLGPLFGASMVMAAGTIVLAVIQAVQEDAILIPELAVGAWIGYFAFIPLCLIVAETYGRADIERFAAINLGLMVLNTAIMYVQKDYRSDDAINQGFGEQSDQIFSGLRLIDDLTRPMGLFTSPLANSVFIAFSIGLFWMLFVATGSGQRRRGGFFWVAMAVSILSLVLAGSRYAVFSFGLMLLVTVIGFAVTTRASSAQRGAVRALLALAVGSVAVLAVAGDSLDALTRRFDTAWEEESTVYGSGTLSRLFLQTDIDEILDNAADTPFLGFGLGTGTNAAYIRGDIPEHIYREAPWAKHMNDVGLFFAVFYILLRFAFVLDAGLRSWRRLRTAGDVAPLVLLSQVGTQVFIGQTVSHIVVGPLTWFFFGLLLARLGRPAPEGTRR